MEQTNRLTRTKPLLESEPLARKKSRKKSRSKPVPDPAGVLKPGTLGWLVDVYFRKGREEVVEELRNRISAPSRSDLVKEGRPVERTDVETGQGIDYESFNPPPFWQVPYSVLRVSFETEAKQDFIYHRGEEVLVPVDGNVTYHFFWSGGKAPATEIKLDEPVRPGAALRIHSAVPHHTWSHGPGRATAWMIMLDASNVAPSISWEPSGRRPSDKKVHVTRRTTSEALAKPWHYALVSWGLLETIRARREQARLSIGDLAALCGLDAGHLSRAEAGTANLSLNALAQIARTLQINVTDLIQAGAQRPWEMVRFSKDAGRLSGVFSKPEGHHRLHFHHVRVNAGDSYSIPAQDVERLSADFTTWICLGGQSVLHFEDAKGPTSELLNVGNVIHFRATAPTKVRALENSEFLFVRYSAMCTCESS